ncbi:hypothetical protein [Pricia sp.]|uniref:hypothetical protein n=1 Tax=Pricia sp. TaxID=2268138 RepID=UPI0035943D95
MKTPTEHSPNIRESEKNALVIRLERTQKDLVQLRGQLDSYRCEPKTYGLFEYIETLKKGMDKLSDTNTEIIDKLREQRKAVSDHIEKAKQQFLKFDQLKDGVADYRTKCIGH